jgi:hypothetical protein
MNIRKYNKRMPVSSVETHLGYETRAAVGVDKTSV